MEQYIYDKNNSLWYELHGDYYFPCLTVPEGEHQPIGIWGRRRLNYLKKRRPILYSDLLHSGKLYSYLADVDEQATEMRDRLVKQMAAQQDITEQMKAQDQMAWVGAMNNTRNVAEEIVLRELIYEESAV